MKRVALIGSSGGGTATLGHTEPVSFLRTVDYHLSLVGQQEEGGGGGTRLVAALFVALDGGKGMDSVVVTDDDDADGTMARLFQYAQTDKPDESFQYEVLALGPLAKVNATCLERQETLIAQGIREGQIDGLICVSCHVGIFRDTLLEAAAAQQRQRDVFPVTGSGGTSLAQVASIFGIQLAGNAGGSVATTSSTKAVSYTHALAVAWGRSYQPWKSSMGDVNSSGGPSWTSVLNSSLPAFWGVCLTKKLLVALKHMIESNDDGSGGGGNDDIFPVAVRSLTQTILALEHSTLPTACAVVMALSLRHKNTLSPESAVVMAAIIASSSCYDSVLTALWAGYLVAAWSDRCLCSSIFYNVPATMTSLICGGGLGGAISILVLPLAEILRRSTSLFRHTLSIAIGGGPWGVWLAFLLGCISCYGSKVGWYHRVHLPLILVEMELGEASFLGAIDELTLVLVCAGVCAAIQVPNPKGGDFSSSSSSQADVYLCRRGLSVNLCCGDFVEVCYPYMEESMLVNIGGYLASGLACAWLVWRGGDEETFEEGSSLPRSMAYLPWPVAVAIASSPASIALFESSIVAFVIAFLFGLMGRNHTIPSHKED